MKGRKFLSWFTLNKVLHAVLVAAFFLTSFYSVTAAKFYSRLVAQVDVNTADAVVSVLRYDNSWDLIVNDDGDLSMTGLQPGATQSINFRVCNYLPASLAQQGSDKVSEVAVTYSFIIKTAQLLPLTFTLTKGAANVAIGAGSFDEETTFKVYNSVSGEFACDQKYSDDYTLTITWPAAQNDGHLLEIGGDYIKVVLDWQQKVES